VKLLNLEAKFVINGKVVVKWFPVTGCLCHVLLMRLAASRVLIFEWRW